MSDVLLITDSLPGATTSMAAMVESLAACLTRKGHRVSVAGIGAEPHVRHVSLGVFVGGLKNPSMIVRGLFELGAALRLAWRVRRAVATREMEAPQLVIAFQPSLFLALTSHLLKRWYRCKLFLVQRDLVPDWLVRSGRLRPGLASWALGRLKELSLRDADCIGIECQENSAFIPAPHRRKVIVLDNWRNYSPAETYDKPLPAQITLVYGGRIGFAQGFDRFLDALLAADLAGALLRIYCDDRGAAELATMRQANTSARQAEIEVRPMLPEGEFLAAASSSSLGVVSLSARMGTHNIPGKLLGYLAAGIPVFAVGPKGSALGRLIEGLGIGLYADADDERMIIDRLKGVVTNRELLERMKRNAIAARSRFAVETAAARIEAALAG